jgi:hypothetical protein
MKSALEFIEVSTETVKDLSAWQLSFVPLDQATIPCGVLKVRTRCFIDTTESSKYGTVNI